MRSIPMGSLWMGVVVFICFSAFPAQAQPKVQYSKTVLAGGHISHPYLNYSHDNIQNYGRSVDNYHGLTAGTIGGQFLMGAFLGGVSGIIGGLASVAVLRCSGDWCEYGEFFGGAFAGYTLGSALGVYIIGNNPSRKASYMSVFLGDVFGLGIGGIVLNNYANGTTEFQKYLVGTAVLSLPLIGAILGYGLSQKPRGKNRQTSLLNISDRHLTVATPTLKGFKSSPLLQNRLLPPGVSIVSFQF